MQRRFYVHVLAGLACSFSIVACGGGQSQNGAAVVQQSFPSAAQVAALAAMPVPAIPVEARPTPTEMWTLTGPFPARTQVPTTASNLWSTLLVEQMPEGAILTENAECMAREIDAYVAAHESFPDDVFSGFVASRCGLLKQPMFLHASIGAREEDTDEELFAAAQELLLELIADLPRNAGEVGIYGERREDQMTWTIVGETSHFELEPVALQRSAGSPIVLRGRTARSRDMVGAAAAWGRTGAMYCEPNAAVQSPQFEFSCDVPADAGAVHVAILRVPEGRLLGAIEATLTFATSPDEDTEFVWPQATDDVPTLVDAVNVMRLEAGVPPVADAPAQSATVASLTPHIAVAAESEDEQLMDQITLGLMAGWDLGLPIVDAGFSRAVIRNDSVSPTMAVANLMASPGTRLQLLDPNTTTLATEMQSLEGGGTVAVVVSYETLGDVDYQAQADAVLAAFIETRANRGHDTRPIGEQSIEQANTSAAAIAQANEPDAALNTHLTELAEAVSARVGAIYLRTTDTASIDWPEDLLNTPNIAASVGIYNDQPAGKAWNEWFVVLYYELD